MKYVFFFVVASSTRSFCLSLPFLPFSYLGGKKSEGERTAAGVGSSLD